MSKDLLREAIADAKAVRETAIANAKLALEEAFTPKLQSMLSAKIQEDEELEDQDLAPEEDEMAVADDSTDMGVENDETEESTDEPQDETYDEGEEVEETEETEEGVYEAEEATEEGEDLEEAEEVEEDAELEEIIKELEEEEEVEEDETMDEADEVIRALQEDEDEEITEDDELEEAYNTIRSLKATINEVNLLNAKLLFSNKLFRANDLNEGQKMKVIETFDRAVSVREVKLVYTTLAESFVGYTPKRKKKMTEGFASKTSKSTKPAKGMIVEGTDFANRMKKLAGLL